MHAYGGFWLRFVAYIIDAILLAIVGGIVGFVFGMGAASTGADMSDPMGAVSTGANLIGLVIAIAYFAGMESSSWQATLGKKALGLIVTDTDGQRISFLRALGRYLAKFLSAIILLIGFIMVAFTDRKQGLHDMIASTLVIKGEPGHAGADPATFA